MMLKFSEHWLTRYGPLISFFHLLLAFVALHFAVTLAIGGSPMTPEIYGPAVYAIPAWVWAGVQVIAEIIASVGAAIRGRKGAAMVISGCVIILPFYALLGAAASLTGQGTIVTAACLWLLMPASVFSVIAGIGAIRYGR